MKPSHVVALLFVPAALAVRLAYAGLPDIPQMDLFTALQNGDVEAVHRIEQKLNAHSITRSMDEAQLHYDIPRLLEGAQQCELRDFKDGTNGGLVGALRCNDIARSSALMLGNANEYLKQASWARKVLLPALAKAFNHPASFDNGLDTADLDGLVESTPAVNATWRSLSQTLPFRKVTAVPVTQAVPQPAIQINGHPETVSIVTQGFTQTPISIIESSSDEDSLSKTLGLVPLLRNFQMGTATYRSHTYSIKVDLFLAASVEFGPLTLNHVAVAVLRSDYLPPGVYAGMPLLRQFGEVAISNSHVLLSKQNGNDCKQPAPLVFASGHNQDGVLMFPVSLNGRAAKATFDSNAGGMVEISRQTGASVTQGGDDAQRGGSLTTEQVVMQIGSWTLRHKAIVPSSWDKPYQATMGNSVLQDATVHLQFGAPSPSICFSSSTMEAAD